MTELEKEAQVYIDIFDNYPLTYYWKTKCAIKHVEGLIHEANRYTNNYNYDYVLSRITHLTQIKEILTKRLTQ